MQKHSTLFLILLPGYLSNVMETKVLKGKILSGSTGGSVLYVSVKMWTQISGKHVQNFFFGERWHSGDKVQCKRNAGENREEGLNNQNAGCEINERIYTL